MVQRAAREHQIDPARSFVVGDQAGDMLLAKAVGAQGLFLRNRDDRQTGIESLGFPVLGSLPEAAEWILARLASHDREVRGNP
jgi:histidinol phosphatase-like enzyme